jgi:hypothetical protein
MRVMIKFMFPVEAGNSAIRSGKVEKVFRETKKAPGVLGLQVVWSNKGETLEKPEPP